MKTLLALLLLIPSLSLGEEINLLCTVTDSDWEGISIDIDIDLEKEMLWDDRGSYYKITQLTDRYLYAYRDLYKRRVTIDRSTGEGKFYNDEGGTLREYHFLCKVKYKLF